MKQYTLILQLGSVDSLINIMFDKKDRLLLYDISMMPRGLGAPLFSLILSAKRMSWQHHNLRHFYTAGVVVVGGGGVRGGGWSACFKHVSLMYM